MKVLRRSLAAALGAAAVLWPAAPAQGAESAQLRLVHAYAPITMLRAQEDPPCDTAEEQFEPTTVHTMLGNPRVKLLAPGKGHDVVTTGPTAGRSPAWGSAITSTSPATR